jgi:hypothetical protein
MHASPGYSSHVGHDRIGHALVLDTPDETTDITTMTNANAYPGPNATFLGRY